MKPVRVGVAGVGVWGEKHARVYQAIPEAELVGVFDESGDRARQIAGQHGCTAYSSLEELIGDCEALSIAVPTVAHRTVFEKVARAGRHALVEKPMAVTVEEADAMRAAAEKAGVQLQIGQVERFNPAILAAAPHLKTPRFIEAHRLALFQPRSLDIDVVFDLMIHDIDLVLAGVGETPAQISAVGVAVLSENEDIANARLEFANGSVANLTASRVSQERLRRIRFFQEDAYVAIDLFEKTCDLLHVDVEQLRRSAPFGMMAAMGAITRRRLAVDAGEPLTLELTAFVRSLRGEGAGAASADAGREALSVAAQVRSAMKARTRQWAAHSTAVS